MSVLMEHMTLKLILSGFTDLDDGFKLITMLGFLEQHQAVLNYIAGPWFPNHLGGQAHGTDRYSRSSL